MITCFGGTATTFPLGDCNILNQDCPPGFGCEPVQANGWTPSCVPDTGFKDRGNPCVTDNSCRAGLYCVNSHCSPICCDINDEPCGPGGICNVNVNTSFGGNVTNACGYAASCVPFSGECEPGTACYPLIDDGRSICAAGPGSAGDGQTCTFINDCQADMVCLSVCHWACLLDAWESLVAGTGGCPAGQTCQQAGINPPTNLGVCTPP